MAVAQGAAGGRRAMTSEERNYLLLQRARSLIKHAVLIAFGIAFMLPFVWMISSSVKPNIDIFEIPVRLLPKSLRLENYIDATNAIPFWRYLWNSTYYTIFATIGAVLSNTFIAYGFARVRWRGRNVVFIIVIATMMLPFQVRMIPLYILFARIGWLNSFLPLIVPNFFGNAFYIFLMRQFMMTLPKELDDAARIDGASEWGIFWRIAVPLSKPAILTVAIFEIIHTWHDFIGPLVYLRHPTKYTLSIGLRLYFTQYGAEWGLLMAAAAMFTIPHGDLLLLRAALLHRRHHVDRAQGLAGWRAWYSSHRRATRSKPASTRWRAL